MQPFDDYQPLRDSVGYWYPIKSREVLAKVISDRISFLRKSIEEIRAQVQERQKLKETLSSDIDKKLCETKTRESDN